MPKPASGLALDYGCVADGRTELFATRLDGDRWTLHSVSTWAWRIRRCDGDVDVTLADDGEGTVAWSALDGVLVASITVGQPLPDSQLLDRLGCDPGSP